jgi:hypothetical protein
MRLFRATGTAGRGFGPAPSRETDQLDRGKGPIMSQNVTLPANILSKVLQCSKLFR